MVAAVAYNRMKPISRLHICSFPRRLFITAPSTCFGLFSLDKGRFEVFSFVDPEMEEAQRGLPRKMNNRPGGTPN
jgi:hypothetical protein